MSSLLYDCLFLHGNTYSCLSTGGMCEPFKILKINHISIFHVCSLSITWFWIILLSIELHVFNELHPTVYGTSIHNDNYIIDHLEHLERWHVLI